MSSMPASKQSADRPIGGRQQEAASAKRAFSFKWWVLGGAAAISLLLYVPSLWYGFVWDDGHLIVNNASLTRTNPVEIFTRGFWYNPDMPEQEGDMNYYRPLVNLSFFVERHEFELSPAGFHMVSILEHAVIVLLLGMVLFELFGSVWPAGIGALLFGINPAHNCIVTFIAGRTYLLAQAFLLVALYALLRARRRTKHAPTWLWPAVMGAGILLSTLSLEGGLVFVAVAAGWLVLNRRQYPQMGRWIAMLAASLVAYFLLRVVAAGMTTLPSSVGRWAITYPLRVINTFGQQMLLFFVPFNQKVIYTVSPVFTDFSIYTVFGVLFLLVPLGFVILTRSVRAALGYAWMVLFLLPFSNLLFLGPAGRMLYLSGPGVIILLVALMKRGQGSGVRGQGSEPDTQTPKMWRTVLLVVLGVYGVALGWQLLRRNAIWRNELTLDMAMVEDAPDSPGAHLNLGAELDKREQPDAAIEQYQLAIDADSNYVPPHNRLAFALVAKGELTKAAEQFRAVAQLAPSADAFNNLALTLKKDGQVDSAIVEYEAALRFAPDSDTTLNNLGRAYMAKGDLRRAVGTFKQILGGNPYFGPAKENLREIYQAMGFPDSAAMVQ